MSATVLADLQRRAMSIGAMADDAGCMPMPACGLTMLGCARRVRRPRSSAIR